MPILSTPLASTLTAWEISVDWDGDGDFTTDGDDVTARVLERGSFAASYGRDQDRSLSPTASGQADLEIDNVSRDYSPDNATSPLYGRMLPARPLRIRALHNGFAHTPFYGHIDDYKVQPAIGERSVVVSALDPIAKLRGAEVSTQLHQGVTTGEAIGLVLDAIDWPADLRDLDPGVTTVRWWWEEGADAFDAITKLVASEGPAALIAADEQGRIMFRDRHHRLLNTASTTAQATFTDDDTAGPSFTDMEYDHGWRDIVNDVTITVDELDPSGEPESVWESADVRLIDASSTLSVEIQTEAPVLRPTVAFTTLTGTVTAAITQESGQALTLQFTAGGSSASISEVVVTAQPVASRRTLQVRQQDTASIDANGLRSLPYEAPWAGVHDADAIASLIIGARAQRLPTVKITVVSETVTTSEQLTHQLTRNLSDRIHITEPETCVDYGFYLDRISHTATAAGLHLTTEFGLEKAPTQSDDVFRFNDSAYGFNDGVFGATGLDDPAAVFLFNVAGRGFNDGVFAT